MVEEEKIKFLLTASMDISEKLNNELNEQFGINYFKSLVKLQPVVFPKELGEQHPYDASVTEGIYNKFGFITSLIEKEVDHLWGNGFHVECENKNAQEILDQWIKDVNFISIGKKWSREFLTKPAGYIELGGSVDEGISGIKVLDSKYIYKIRDLHGNIVGYNQLIRGFYQSRDFSKNPLIPITKTNQNGEYIPLDVKNIVEFSLNKIGDAPYGLGMIYPNLSVIDNLLGLRKDLHMLMHRKANNPYIIKMGVIDPSNPSNSIWPSAGDITSMGQKLEYLHNKHEWVVGPDIDIKSLDFGTISEKFKFPLDNDIDFLTIGFQTTKTNLGLAISAGMGSRVPQEHTSETELHIQSVQEELNTIIEKQIFKRVLLSHGFDVNIKIIWGEANEEDKKTKIQLLQGLLGSVQNPALRIEIETNIAQLLDYDDNLIDEGLKQQKEEEQRQQPVVPGSLGRQKQTLLPKLKEFLGFKKKYHIRHFTDVPITEDLKKDYSLIEWLGFNYRKFTNDIDKTIDKDNFEDLRASNDDELIVGYLSSSQIEELRNVFREAFNKGLSVKTIASTLYSRGIISDLYTLDENGDKILRLDAETRSLMVARTEATRLSGLGAIENYKTNGIEKIRWTAAISDRTCERCLELNGRIFEIVNFDVPWPAHVFCRCALSPVVVG